jgi:integrase/recombinase XerD
MALLQEEIKKEQSSKEQEQEQEVYRRKIELVTEGLHRFIYRELIEEVSRENAIIIAEYIIAQKTDINISDTYRKTTINTLIIFSKFLKNKHFKDITSEEILSYFDSLRKSESSDPLHKWIGTYNIRKQQLLKFFKWLYYPNEKPENRKIPPPMQDISTLRRKEQSVYKPTDLWTTEDDLLFLRYCANKRDRCYHAISRDLSCRPHEILKLRVKDIVFKTSGNSVYAEVLVNGKTGNRHIPLFDSIPYVKDWIDNHPQPGNTNAILIPSLNYATFGRKMSGLALNNIYRHYKVSIFPKLLEDPSVTPEDKQKITELLKKPWNPYIRRHSALTEKSKILKEHVLRQHAGWSGRSQMHLKYLHYYGNESSESLLQAYGIFPKESQESDTLKPKQCPNCSEPNKPDSKFCAKCRMVLTYDSYAEVLEGQKQDKDRLTIIEQQMQALITAIGSIKDQNQVDTMAKTLYGAGILTNTLSSDLKENNNG